MRFQPPPGYQPIYNPIVPYTGPIYGGLKLGMSLFIQGTVPNGATGFAINLQTGLVGVPDIALHFNPRFTPSETVMNIKKGGNWQTPETPSGTPFREGESFQLLFIVISEGYQIKVNGSDFYLFKHRMPVEQVSALSIGGEVSVHMINIIGGGIGHILGYPGLGQAVSIPYTVPIYGGLRTGMSVHIQGAIPCDVTRFHVSLQSAEAKCSDKALYINPRFNPKEFVVFNTFKNRKFQEQERVTDMPFILGESFELVIIVTGQGYQVSVNGREFYMFKHRMPLARVLALGIGGDVFVESVNIMGGEQGAMIRPGPGYVGAGSYTQSIPGGLKAGMSLYLRGTIPSEDINSFQINLEGGGDVAIQVNPQFSGWRGVVFKTRDNGEWQAEEKVNAMPFRKGESFELVFNVTSEGYQVNVDGRELHMYKHRVPLEQVTDLVIGGEVSVQSISIIPDEEDKLEIPEYDQGLIQEYPAPGDVSSSAYSQAIEGGLGPGMSLYFEGTVHTDSDRFHINLEGGGDILLHFNPRFKNWNLVVFNSHESGGWQSEERPSGMPFREGEDFQLVFNVTTEGYQVIVNGSVLHVFKHRVPVDHVTSVVVAGCVSVHSIIIKKEQGLIQEFPAPGDVSSDTYEKPIEGGLKPGMLLYMRGTVSADNPNRFHINLVAGDDLPLHFNPRFRGWQMVVFNTYKNGWQSEERPSEMPFSVGGAFDLIFNVTLKGYQVIVNGCVLHMYKHRIPVDRVTALAIGGDVSVESLVIIRGSGVSEGSGGSGYNWRFLPMMGTQPIYNPPIPYTRMIPGGLTPKKTIALSGRVLPDADRFAINFNVSSSGDLAFHFNPRMNDGSVVRNSYLRGNWGSEERDVKFNPFQRGRYFQILIRCGKQQFMVFVNGKHMFNYYHRFQPFTQIDSLHISGDVQLFHMLM
ncbi:uncharacterized protein LOC135235529 isoform X2 [Anguilla rostrata]|uniref:uncharacterized protein LOC135235529 isoform X2 n=1 Tax=Anguilla rostrata TaxID=7938 RepID=UPI0030D1FDED